MSAPDPNLDKHVDDLLAGRSELSRRYRAGSTEQPPAALDQRVLTQAAAAVGKDARIAPVPTRSRARWMVPFAVAATVLLSFAVFREAGVGTGVVLREEVAPASLPVPVEALQEQEQPEPQQAQLMEDRSAARERRSVDEAGNAEAAKVLADAAPPPPVPTSVSPPQIVTPPVALQPSEITVAVSEAPATNAVQGMTIQRSPPAAPARASPETVEVEANRERRTPMAAPLAVAPPATESVAPASPDDWLRDIRTLREAGRNEDADAALESFLKAYPDYFDRNPGVARP